MNRRGFLSLSLLAPVAGVMAARDAMAAPAISSFGSFGFVNGPAGEFIAREPILEWPPRAVRKLVVELDGTALEGQLAAFDERIRLLSAFSTRPTEDESVSAQFTADLAFLRDEPGVVS